MMAAVLICLVHAVGNMTWAYGKEFPCAEDYAFVTEDGAWCWFSDPRAIYSGDEIFGGFVDKEGSIWAFQYNPATQDRAQTKVFDRLDYDDHANPSIIKLPDGRLAMFFSGHSDAPIYYVISKRPEDISEWDGPYSVSPEIDGKCGFCYSNPFILSEEGMMYLFFRGPNYKPCYIATTDLKTWSAPVTLLKSRPGRDENGRPYAKYASNGKDKIFIAFTDGHPRNQPANSIYFMLYDGGKYYKADGTEIPGVSDIYPDMTDKVYDATETYDKAWIWDVAFDKDENPVIVYARFSDTYNVHSYWYARWTGEKWENIFITEAGQWFMRNDYNDKNYIETEMNYSGGVYLDHSNPDIVYTSRPINNVFEIEKWTLTGDGSRWKKTAVTCGSEHDNVRPFVVRDCPEGMPGLMWMYNYRYPSYTAFDCAIRLNRLDKGFSGEWSKKAVSEVADRVSDRQMKHMQETSSDLSEAKCWRSAVLYNGLIDWVCTVGDGGRLKFIKDYFDRLDWQVGDRMYHADDHCIAQAYLDMYGKYGDSRMLVPTKARMDWVIANPPGENIDITEGHSDRWWWCDALYMAPAIYMRLYSITGDKKYVKFAHKEYLATYGHLYDTEERMFFRDGNFIDKRNEEGKKIFWSRGNGWVLAGLAEILKALPQEDRKYRPFYESLFVEMCEKIASLQGADGYWRTDLLSPDIYPMPETSGTGLFVYAMMYGINAGILDDDAYLPVVKKGWEAMVEAVNTEGRVGWTQMVADRPGAVERKNEREYSAGSLLMAASEIYRYIGTK